MANENRSIKLVFFTIIFVLLISAIYIIYSDNNNLAIDINEKAKKETLKDTLTLGVIEIDTLNPLLTKNKDLQYILKLIYDPLLDITEDFKLSNKLAKEWSKIDNKTYIIKLEEKVLWQDGKEFTAEDVKFTIDALKTNWRESIYNDNIKEIEEVAIIDEYTIKIYLSKEVDFFEYKLIFPILAKHQYDEKFKLIAEKPSGTGNYYFKTISNNEIVLTNNHAKTKNLKICKYNGMSEIYSDFLKEKLDIVITSNINLQEYIGTIGYKTQIISDRNFDYILINKDNEVLNNLSIRQAIKYGINKKEIIYNIYKNKYKIADFPQNNCEDKSEFNTTKAKELLIKEGWTYKKDSWYKNGEKLQFKLTVNSNNEKRIEVAKLLKKQLESIGISIEIIKMNEENYKYALKNNYYELLLTGMIVPLEPNFEDYFKFADNKTNEILEEISKIENKEIKNNKISELKKIYEEEIPFIGLYFNSNILLLNVNLKGDFKANWFNIFYNIENWHITI